MYVTKQAHTLYHIEISILQKLNFDIEKQKQQSEFRIGLRKSIFDSRICMQYTTLSRRNERKIIDAN